MVDILTIRWPNGAVQTLHDIKSDQVLKVTEPASSEVTLMTGKAP